MSDETDNDIPKQEKNKPLETNTVETPQTAETTSNNEINTDRKRLLDLIKKAKENIQQKEAESVKKEEIVEAVKYMEEEKQKELQELKDKLSEQEKKNTEYEDKVKILEEKFGNMSQGSKINVNQDVNQNVDPNEKVKLSINGQTKEFSRAHLDISDKILQRMKKR